MRKHAHNKWISIPVSIGLILMSLRMDAVAQTIDTNPGSPSTSSGQGAITAFSRDCLQEQLSSILQSIRNEIASIRSHNKEIEDARNSQGWFGYVVGGITYWGTGANDPFQTQINFNNQRIQTLTFLLNSFEGRANSLSGQLGNSYDISKAIELLSLINTLRRVKGVPQLSPLCTVDMASGPMPSKHLFVSPEQWDEHQKAISTSKDVSVAVITTAGGVITIPLAGGAAAGSLTPLIPAPSGDAPKMV